MQSRRKKLYPSANKFTTYIPVYLNILCPHATASIVLFLLRAILIWSLSISSTWDFCSCRYITSFLHHQNFPIKGLFPTRLINMIFVTYNRQHTHNTGIVTVFQLFQFYFNKTVKLNMPTNTYALQMSLNGISWPQLLLYAVYRNSKHSPTLLKVNIQIGQRTYLY